MHSVGQYMCTMESLQRRTVSYYLRDSGCHQLLTQTVTSWYRESKAQNLLYLTPAPDWSHSASRFWYCHVTRILNKSLHPWQDHLATPHTKSCLVLATASPATSDRSCHHLHTILSQLLAFRAETIDDFLARGRGHWIPCFPWALLEDHLTPGKGCISSMLNPNPEKRPTANEFSTSHGLPTRRPPKLPRICCPTFALVSNARQKLRKGIEAVRLANRIAALSLMRLEEGEDGDPTRTLARLAKLPLAYREPEHGS